MNRKRIDLNESDWLWATWRPPVVRTRPPPRTFDLTQCAKVVSAVSKGPDLRWAWDSLPLPDSLTREEGEFWFRVLSNASPTSKPKELATWALRQKLDGHVKPVELKAAFKAKPGLVCANLIGALAALFDSQTIVELMLNEIRSSSPAALQAALVGLHQYVLPFMSPAEMESLRSRLEPHLKPAAFGRETAMEFHLAAMLGMHTQIQTVVRSWTESSLFGIFAPQLILSGVGTAAEFEQQVRRLSLKLRTGPQVRAWLAHTECSALDWVHQSIAESRQRESAEEMLQAFCLVREPDAARWLLEFRADPGKAHHVRQWFSDNPAAAIEGLLPVTRGGSKLADAAVETLTTLARSGHKALVEQLLERTDPSIASTARRLVFPTDAHLPPPFDQSNTPAWLQPKEAAKPKPLPAWIIPATLPQVTVDGHLLNESQMLNVLGALQRSSLSAVDPLLVDLKQHARPEHLEAVAWKLFQAWQTEGAPTAHKWAMHALGILGSDAVAIELAQLVRSWPSQSLHARAAVGLECLRGIGTHGALMQLDMLARKLRFAGLRAKAKLAMDQIAAAKGLSREDLEDQVIPDCGLDARGTRVFDLGGRQLFLALDQSMKPMLKDDTGALRPGLPRPAKTDDPQKSAAAKAEWTLLKKQISQVIKAQVDRLKKALAGGRRWSVPAFESLCNHPLMRHLIRGQIWALYGPQGSGPGRCITSFRVTQEGDWSDASDQPLARPNDATAADAGTTRIGLLHPIHIDPSQRRAWENLLNDYKIIPPVPQLTRNFFSLSTEESTGTDIERFANSPCPANILISVLQNMGWEPQSRAQAGNASTFTKPFVHAGLTGIAVYSGSGGYGSGLCINRVYFIGGIDKPESFTDYTAALRLGKIDPAIVSEAIREIGGAIAAGTRKPQ